MIRPRTVIVGLFCLGAVLSLVIRSDAAGLVLVRGNQAHAADESMIKRLAEFYGLDLQRVDISSPAGTHHASSLIRRSSTVAVLVSADVVPEFYRIWRRVRTHPQKRLPTLIFGISGRTDPRQLTLWSGGTVRGCSVSQPIFRATILEVGGAVALSKQLAGIQLPAMGSPVCGIETASPDTSGFVSETMLTARDSVGTNAVLMTHASSRLDDNFFVAETEPIAAVNLGKPPRLADSFSSLAPLILFLSYAAGDYGWHLPRHYANLTVDDAWLREPYGNLDYAALVSEMGKHNFHLTVAFVPWNFDRSQADAIKLFRSHPNRLSVCVHGNNHAHREFGPYETNPLPAQVADIRQAVARMDRFSALTGIPYDRFMIFPHAVAPEATFAALKTDGFLGTANASNVPLGSAVPDDPIFVLRPYTTIYSDFLSFSRYPASGEIQAVDIAIQAYLGNPLLFYGHADLFKSGADAFNSYADLVNRLQPDTEWTSLGEIARHSYLLRRRTDGAFDVQMLSSDMDLENPTDAPSVFYIHIDSSKQANRNLTVDGSPLLNPNATVVQILIPPYQSRRVRLNSDNGFDPSTQDIRKRSVHVYLLRMLSDFRDVQLSRTRWGNAVTQFYYQRRLDFIELYVERYWWIGLLLGVGTVAMKYHRSQRRRSRSACHKRQSSVGILP